MKEDKKSIGGTLENVDPFDIPLSEVKSRHEDEYRNVLLDRLFEEYKDWIDEKFKENEVAKAAV